MTYYTLYKLIKCLAKDSSNHSDLEEMFKEGLKDHYKEENIDVMIDDGYILDGHYHYDLSTSIDKFQYAESLKISFKELSHILV